MKGLASAAWFMVLCLVSWRARATYSVLATSPDERLVGSAGASCVNYPVIRIERSLASRGAIVAQAGFDDPALDHAEELLRRGANADTIIRSVTDEARYPSAKFMQWAIADTARVVHATGREALAFAESRDASGGGLSASVQGNLLSSSRVLSDLYAGLHAPACDLPERLVHALEAVSAGHEGDKRCVGVPATSAFVSVVGPNGPVFRVSVPDLVDENPTLRVRGAYDAWRAEHPCPAPTSSTSPTPEPASPERSPSCAQIPATRTESPCPHAGPLALLFLWLLWRRAKSLLRTPQQ